MDTPDTALEIRTLGRFSISVAGKAVATDWPDETMKILFCSLLSPLDLYFTWDRLCRSMWGVPATPASRRLMEETFIRPLNRHLTRELGFNPLITGRDGIRIAQQRIHLDATEFHGDVVEGVRLLSLGNRVGAHEKFNAAVLLYSGSYLPGIQGKIISSTRNELGALFQIALKNSMPTARN